MVVKIPSKKKKYISGNSFAIITYPITFRFCRLAVGEFLFVFKDFLFRGSATLLNLDVSNCRKNISVGSGERERERECES